MIDKINIYFQSLVFLILLIPVSSEKKSFLRFRIKRVKTEHYYCSFAVYPSVAKLYLINWNSLYRQLKYVEK